VNKFPSSSGSVDPLHIGETIKSVWEKPFPNALLWPMSLIWKNIRPALGRTLETGKDMVVSGIQSTTKAAIAAVLHSPFLPIPAQKRLGYA